VVSASAGILLAVWRARKKIPRVEGQQECVKEVDVKVWRQTPTLLALAGLTGLLVIQLRAAEPGNAYLVQNLVSDGSIAAVHTDPLLINAWGLAASPSSPWWVADNGTNVSTLYNAAGVASSLVVQVPGHPTGAVYSGGTGFKITNGPLSAPARFLFAAEDGTISGWSSAVQPPPPTHSFIVVPNAAAPAHGAIYKGLAVASTASGDFLYAADFHNNHVDVFDSSFHPVTVPAAFIDPRLPKGFAPFGIQNIAGKILVSYAKQDDDAVDEIAGDGLGFVNAFEPDGTFIARVASRDALNAPWGIAMAPANFGRFSGDLMVGNFGDGRINVFDAKTFEPKGHLKNTQGKAVVIEGLWGIAFGNNGAAGRDFTLYFAAGPHDENAGLFGRIDAQ
jgi:uncharacterized protein (TIGR03118 family)